MTLRERQVIQALASVLGCEPIDAWIDMEFYELGIDSLTGMRLIGKLADSWDLEIDLTIDRWPTKWPGSRGSRTWETIGKQSTP